MAETLLSLFAAARPSDVTVLLDEPGGRVWTYGEADAAAASVANGLRRRGVGAGDRVAVQAEKAPEIAFLYLACLRAGAVFLPMNPAYTDAEVGHIVGDADATVVLRSVDEVAALGAGEDPAFDDVTATPDDLAVLLYTSGTTGRPKGAMLTHSNLASNAAALREAWGFRPDDVLLHALPVFHAHGLFAALNPALAAGAGMVWLPRFETDAVLDALPRSTVFMGVPTYYTRLLEDPRFDHDRCRNIRLFVSGSAPLLASTHRAVWERTGHEVLERYGMTETVMNTSNPLAGPRKAGTVGLPLPGVEVRIDAPDEGGVGGIELRGPNIFGGYWGRPELNATEFTADGFFRTGDLGHLDADGYLTIAGRSKDLVISGGLNVHPVEVEEALDALDGVLESAVVGVPDPDLGEAVVAVVVAAPGHVLDPEAIRRDARRTLAGFKVPKRIVLVEQLPRNAMGKVEKAVLRQTLGTSSP